MKIHQQEPFSIGYHPITELNGKYREMMMDFGILKISADMEFEDNLPLERVFVLLYGEIEVEFNGKIVKGTRPTYTNDTIWSVNLPRISLSNCVVLQKRARSQSFELKMNVISCR